MIKCYKKTDENKNKVLKRVNIWKDDEDSEEDFIIGYRHGYLEQKYLHTTENDKIAEIIKETGSCGELVSIDDKLKLDDNSWALIACTICGPQWGIIIINNIVFVSGGTNSCTAGEYIIEVMQELSEKKQSKKKIKAKKNNLMF